MELREMTVMEEEYFILGDVFEMDIRPYLQLVHFEAGERILEEGGRPEYLFYLLHGRVKLYLSHENGRITLINFLPAPCFIGEMELLDPERLSNGVQAITACDCYAIRLDQCREKLLNDRAFLRYLCRFLSEKASGNTSNYSRNQAYPLKKRLSEFILETAVNGVYREPHGEVAEFLGVTYRHLLYVLAQLVDQGLLEKTVTGYKILDAEGLRRNI